MAFVCKVRSCRKFNAIFPYKAIKFTFTLQSHPEFNDFIIQNLLHGITAASIDTSQQSDPQAAEVYRGPHDHSSLFLTDFLLLLNLLTSSHLRCSTISGRQTQPHLTAKKTGYQTTEDFLCVLLVLLLLYNAG